MHVAIVLALNQEQEWGISSQWDIKGNMQQTSGNDFLSREASDGEIMICKYTYTICAI